MDKHQHNACKIQCGEQTGTGFLISATQAVSAAHIFVDDTAASASVGVIDKNGEKWIPANIELRQDSPLALLTLSESVEYEPTRLYRREIDYDEPAYAFGFPESVNQSYRSSFVVNHMLTDRSQNAPDANLILDVRSTIRDMAGMSGAALIIDKEIAGILLREHLEGDNACIVFALAGPEFRDELSRFGVQIPLGDDSLSASQNAETIMLQLHNEQNLLRTELNQQLDSRLQKIMEMRLNGKRKAAWDSLMEVLPEIKTSVAKSTIKSAYFHVGALWALEERNGQENELIKEAISIDSDLDIRIYLSEKALQENNVQEAAAVLRKIDCIEILNQRMKVYYSSGNYESAIQLPDSYPAFLLTEMSHEILGICKLENGDFLGALKHAEIIMDKYPDSPSALRIKACAYWGLAVAELGASISYWKCLIINPAHYIPGKEETKNLEKAYDALIRALELSEEGYDKEWLLSALTAISAIFPDKDEMLWLNRLEREFPMSPPSILFRVFWDKQLTDERIEAYLKYEGPQHQLTGIIQAKYILMLRVGRCEDARALLTSHQAVIQQIFSEDINETLFSLAQREGSLEKANDIIAKTPNSVKKTRFKMLACIQWKLANKKTIARELLSFTKKTQEPADFNMAYQYFARIGDWKNAARIANAWYKVMPTLSVQMRRAEALTNTNRATKAMQVIAKIEDAGVSSPTLLLMKTRNLYKDAKFDGVLDVLQDIPYEEKDYEIVLMKASSYIVRGELDDAIECLKLYIDKGYRNKEVYQKLILLLRTKDLNEAWKYARKMHEDFPKDRFALQDYCLLGAICGMQTPQSAWEELQSFGNSNSPYFKALSIDEALNYYRQEEKRWDEKTNDFIQMKYPLCVYADLLPHGNVSLNMYLQWHYGRLGTAPAFCGAGYVDVIPDDGSQIILDITAILVAHELQLLDKACEKWECFISPKLIPLILTEINDMNSVQYSRYEEEQAVLEAMRQSNLEYIDKEYDLEIPNLYHYELAAAQELGYLIVSDKLLEVKDGPDIEIWKEWSIDKDCFLSLLHYKGLLSADASCNEVDIEPLLQQYPKGFIIDREILDQLVQAGALSVAADALTLAIPNAIKIQIERDIEKFKLYREVVVWLQNVMMHVKELINDSRLRLLKDNKYYSHEETTIRTSLLTHELEQAKKRDMFLWCDDRFAQHYMEKGILSVLSIIRGIYRNDASGMFLKMNRLFEKHVGNLLPSADFLMHLLRLCRIDKETEKLKESQILKSVRECVCGELGMSFCLSKEIVPPLVVSEQMHYMGNLKNLIAVILKDIWSSQEDALWKRAASSWVMEHFILLIAGADFGDGYENFLPDIEMVLILAGIAPLRKVCESYYSWLHGYLESSWNASPDDEIQAARYVLNFCSGAEEDVQTIYVSMVEKLFPGESFRYYLLNEYHNTRDEKSIETTWQNPYRPRTADVVFQVRELEDTKIKDMLKSEDGKEELLSLLYEAPQYYAERVLLILKEAVRETGVSKEFLATLFWYVPCEHRQSVYNLYMIELGKDIR